MIITTEKKLLTIRQTAALGLINEHRLRQWRAENKLPGICVGNRFYVNIDLLEKMIEEESQQNKGTSK